MGAVSSAAGRGTTTTSRDAGAGVVIGGASDTEGSLDATGEAEVDALGPWPEPCAAAAAADFETSERARASFSRSLGAAEPLVAGAVTGARLTEGRFSEADEDDALPSSSAFAEPQPKQEKREDEVDGLALAF